MEISCNRCHQTVQAENCYCPSCGMPQLLYAADAPMGQAQPAHWDEAVPDAATVRWKPALRTAMLLAVPAGIFCSMVSPLGLMGLVLMAAAAFWTVVLYLRSQRRAWITIGAGARIGLVTGLLSSWVAAATTGMSLYVLRYFFHQGSLFDSFWQSQVIDKAAQQWASAGLDAQAMNSLHSFLRLLNSPEGRAGSTLSIVFFFSLALVAFSVAGGALGARMHGRSRRTEA